MSGYTAHFIWFTELVMFSFSRQEISQFIDSKLNPFGGTTENGI